MQTTFRGSMVALVTPFDANGSIDWDALAKLVDFQLENGTHGLVICGTTGEASTMTAKEQGKVLAFVVKHVNGRIPVIGGAGSISTQTAVDLSKQAKDAGVDGLLVVTPPYNKPSQSGLIAHYNAVTEATELPLILYNVPGRTNCYMQPETVEALADNPYVVAIKEATADLQLASEIYERCGDRVALLSGDDFTAFPFLAVGGIGWISVTANIAPAQMVALYDAWEAGDIQKARELHYKLLPLHRAMFTESNPIPCKKALQLMGFCTGAMRLPLQEMGEGNTAELAKQLQASGLL